MDDRADRELENLLVKRHNARDGDALLEPSYQESVNRFNAKLREENLRQWSNYYQKMSRLHALLAEENARKAELLEGD